eukprot:scaffold60299_cov19-Phaeocystis_antarctica.AAC.1
MSRDFTPVSNGRGALPFVFRLQTCIMVRFGRLLCFGRCRRNVVVFACRSPSPRRRSAARWRGQSCKKGSARRGP